jgi:hypothetical protein
LSAREVSEQLVLAEDTLVLLVLVLLVLLLEAHT